MACEICGEYGAMYGVSQVHGVQVDDAGLPYGSEAGNDALMDDEPLDEMVSCVKVLCDAVVHDVACHAFEIHDETLLVDSESLHGNF